jgi:hypothetical protein
LGGKIVFSPASYEKSAAASVIRFTIPAILMNEENRSWIEELLTK